MLRVASAAISGNFMSVRLRDTDALAVDLILDRAAAAQDNGGSAQATLYASHARVSNDRVAAVEKVLKLLEVMPSPEPTQDLLQRTLDRLESGTGAAVRGDSQPQIDHGRPVA